MTPRNLVFLLCCVVFGSVAIHHISTGSQSVAAQARIVRVAAASGAVGGTINIPIEIVSQGDENAIGFSLTFDAAVLSNPQVMLGSGATGATINSNAGQAAQGRFGVALAFPASQKFTAGVQQMAVVTFSVAASANFGTTNLGFGDQPVVREVADITANPLAATFTGGAVNLTKGFEADVQPRPDGDNNGVVTITDWTQVGLFVAGIDTPAPGNEFQRADCAPRSGLGDGKISIIDWTQAGRYAAALDAATPAGGPTMATSSSLADGGRWPVAGGRLSPADLTPNAPKVQARRLPTPDDRFPTSLSIEIEARGNENALGFSLIFNASHWRLLSVKAGRDANEAVLHINSTQADQGRIGVALAMPIGKTIARGEQELVVCEFVPIASRKGLALQFDFGDFPVRREMADVEANPLIGNFSVEGQESKSFIALLTKNSRGQDALSIVGDNLSSGIESSFGDDAYSLSGTSVTVIDSRGNALPARLLYVSPTILNCIISDRIAEGTATVIVTNANGDNFRTLIEITRR